MAERGGQELLDHVWFCTIKELHDIVCLAEQAADRIAAADVLLRYYTGRAQSINEPFTPETDPGHWDEDGEEDDD